MKRLMTLLTVFLGMGVLGIGLFGCSSSGTSSADLSNRLYMAAAESGILTPTGSGDEYVITLENVLPDVLWFTDRPQRQSGKEPTADYVQYGWSRVYGQVAPNAVMKFYVSGENAGIFATLKALAYDAVAKTLTFQATLLNTTSDEWLGQILTFDTPVLTVLNNVTDLDDTPLTFVIYGETAFLDAAETDGQYTLTQQGLDDSVLWASNAPASSSHVTTTQKFVAAWDSYFSEIPPNASIFGITEGGELQTYLFELTDPEYPVGGDGIAFSATSIGPEPEPGTRLNSATLIIDSASQFVGDPSKLYVQNLKTSGSVDVYVTFGADSCITQDNISIDGKTGECKPALYGECVFTVGQGEKKEINLNLCRADLTFRFNSAEGCGVTKAEANMNVPNWDDAWNISLVDGWNENVRIDVVTADIGSKTLGPTVGQTGNQEAFGVYPYGCDICVARESPPCSIPMGNSECKEDINGQHVDQYHPEVPCQWNHPRPNTVTVSVVD